MRRFGFEVDSGSPYADVAGWVEPDFLVQVAAIEPFKTKPGDCAAATDETRREWPPFISLPAGKS